jgi:glycosyltransferase involved in cell wall biosynthesis
VSRSRGDKVAFLDSDDQWLPEKLERQSRVWERSPEAALVYSAEIWMRKGTRVNPPAHYRGASGRILERSIRACVISPSTAVIKRSVFESLQGFRPDYPVCEDYELWLRLCSRYSVAYLSDPLVVRYGGRPDQLSFSYPAMDYWRVRALASLAGSSMLTDLERLALAREIVRRGRVLIKGYRSRGKRSLLAEVVNLVGSVVPDFRP